jgi:hypothetical protein
LVAGEEKALEVTAENTKCMVRCRAQNAGQIHNLKKGNKSFEGLGQFRYLATTITYQNSILIEIKSRMKSGKACCHSVQNILRSFCCTKIYRLRYTEVYFCLLFCNGVKLGRSL